MSASKKKRVLIILHAGDYYEAYQRMVKGLGEAYRHHNYALHSVEKLAQRDDVEEAAVLGCITKDTYDHVLDIGFRVMGAATSPHKDPQEINRIIADYNPSHIVLRTPSTSILQWAIRHDVRTITLLADSFFSRNWKERIKNFWLARLLNNSAVEWVGNHHINSCVSLARIGVLKDKVVPWDWPWKEDSSSLFGPKTLSSDRGFIEGVYVGSISESKGVTDLLQGLSILRQKGIDIRLKLAGRPNNPDLFKQLILDLNLGDSVSFLGIVPNQEIVNLMRGSDIVFVPSRHAYPEGLPMTIFEALYARTPIVASDHPMFLNNIEDGFSALFFHEQDPTAIAQRVEKLIRDPDLYFKLSTNALAAWKKLQIPVVWADFIHAWLDDTPESIQWLHDESLASDAYQDRLK
jgi:glycosyltransferase involved in cell wall biosynthesis